MALRLLLLAVPFLFLPLAASAAPNEFDECLTELRDSRADPVECVAGYKVPSKVREQLRGLTGGAVKDAACLLKVNVARETVVQALRAVGTVQLPAQPVACALATGRDPIYTEFTLAPTVEFQSGRAISAKPGIANIVGAPPAVGAMLQNWLNASPLVESTLVRAINDFLSRPPG